MTCRLPQTPRTPTSAAAHYFDDIFTDTGRPKKPHHLRRSSTARSIGHRSDWGDHEDEDGAATPLNRQNSVGYLNPQELQQKVEMDQHVAHYVSDQLERLRVSEDAAGDVDCGEFETSLDMADSGRNGRWRNGGKGYFD